MLTAFYRAKLAALHRDVSGRPLDALREAVREERRAAMRALAEKWALRRAAAREVCRKRDGTLARRPEHLDRHAECADQLHNTS